MALKDTTIDGNKTAYFQEKDKKRKEKLKAPGKGALVICLSNYP